MLTSFSLWMIYTASYWPCYVVCLIAVGVKIFDKYKDLSDGTINLNFFIKSLSSTNISETIVLTALIILSIVVIKSISHIETNTKIVVNDVSEITYEMSGNVATNVISVISVLFSDFGILIAVVIFFGCGTYYVISRKIHYSLLFTLPPLGYHVFEFGEGKSKKVLIARGSRDAIRLAAKEHENYLDARELESGVFIVPKI